MKKVTKSPFSFPVLQGRKPAQKQMIFFLVNIQNQCKNLQSPDKNKLSYLGDKVEVKK